MTSNNPLIVTVLILLHFDVLRSSNTEFVIEPREQTVAAHQRVEYQCQHATASVEWLINDDQVTVDRFPGVSTDQQSKSSRLVYKLIFNSVSSNYNNSMIQCKARFRDGDIMYQNETVSVLLLIQGPPSAVGDINRQGPNITWTPPFSLDLTDVDPDILYCLTVFNISRDSSLLFGVCNLSEPFFMFDDLCEHCLYQFKVIPRSNGSSVNGTLFIKTETYISLYLKAVHRVNSSIWLYLDKGEGDVSPAEYVISLYAIDGVYEPRRTLQVAIMHQTYTNLTLGLSAADLPGNRRWRGEIQAAGSPSPQLANISEVSTHDIQNITVSSLRPDEISLTGDIIDGSNITDLLVLIYSVTSERYLFHPYHFGPSIKKLDIIVSSIPEGKCFIWVFALYDNNKLFERPATGAMPVVVASSEDVGSSRPGFNYQLHPNSSGTKVLCNFKEDSNATGCLVVVLLFPFPFTNTTLDIIEVIASYQFNRTSNTAVGFIPDYTPERYIMGAYEITEIRNGAKNNAVIAVLIPVAVLTVFVVIITVFVLISVKKHLKVKRTVDTTLEADGNSTNTSSSEARPLLNRGVSHGGVPSQVNSTPRESGRDSQLLPVAGSEIHEDTEVALTQSPSTHDHLSSPDLLSMQEQPPGPPLAESSFIDHKAPPPAKSSEDESNVDSSPDELPLAIGPVPTQTGSPGESTPPASPPPTGSPGESTPPASVSLSTKTYSSAAVLSNLPLESSPQAALSTAKTHQIPSANNEGDSSPGESSPDSAPSQPSTPAILPVLSPEGLSQSDSSSTSPPKVDDVHAFNDSHQSPSDRDTDSETKTLDTDKYPVRETAPVNVGCVYVGSMGVLSLPPSRESSQTHLSMLTDKTNEAAGDGDIADGNANDMNGDLESEEASKFKAAVPVFNFDEGCLPQQCGSVPDDGDEHKTTTCRPRELPGSKALRFAEDDSLAVQHEITQSEQEGNSPCCGDILDGPCVLRTSPLCKIDVTEAEKLVTEYVLPSAKDQEEITRCV